MTSLKYVLMSMIEWAWQDNNLYTYWLVYSILCIPAVFLILAIFPQRLLSTWYYNAAFFYIMSATLFVLGLLIAFIIVFFLHYLNIAVKEKETVRTAEYPDYQHSPVVNHSVYGEGFGFKVTTNDTLPKAMRQKMLVAINQFSSSHVNKINSVVLGDDVDDMRLYAKSLIEKQERKISHLIKYFTEKIEISTNKKLIAFYKKQKALVLWEQVYNYLVNNESLFAVLIKIKALAYEALDVLPNDMELPLLLARIALRYHELDEAKKWLRRCETNGTPEYKIISYIAEINYAQRHFSGIKKTLSSEHIKGIIGLQPIVSFWTSHD